MDHSSDGGGTAGGMGSSPQIDARREPRVAVSWRAMFRLPNGRTFEAKVRDISESGIGLVCADAVPQNTVVDLAVAVPDLTDATKSVTVKGKFRTAFVVVHRDDYRVGGVWSELDNASREMFKQHVKRHRYAGSGS